MAQDWEDIAADDTWIYVGDIGDNGAHRDHVRVIRAREPAVDQGQAKVTGSIVDWDLRAFLYPDGAHDAETLAVDPRSGDVFVVTKMTDGHSGVYRAAAPFALPAGDPARVMERVASLDFGSEAIPGMVLATGGDVSPTGDAVLILTYNSAHCWWRGVGQPLAAAFAGPACTVPLTLQPAHEAIAFDPDGRAYRSMREGQHAPIFHYVLAHP